jgi:hypothetical protein
MTIRNKIFGLTGVLGMATLSVMAGPPVIVVPAPPPPIVVSPPPPPVVVVQPAAPIAPSVTVTVPETYVWDGDEYVGMVGDQYYYLGPNQAWLPMPTDRLAFFHGWEKQHKDWMKDAIHNEKYRRDAQGHEHPLLNHESDRDHDR